MKEEIQGTPAGRALAWFKAHRGVARTSEIVRSGIHPRTLYELRDEGLVEVVSRGVYRLAGLDPMENPGFVAAATRVPNAVICLISALAFHDITSQIPHFVYLAIKRGAETPRVEHPPLSVHRFSDQSLNYGIGVHQIDGIDVKIFSPEKTLADCFKFRNKIGLDVFQEAFKLYRSRFKLDVGKLIDAARVCRVESAIRPYLEASL